MAADPQKVQGLAELPVPKDVKELQSYLGLQKFMQHLIPWLSHHTAPLPKSLGKERTFTGMKPETHPSNI